MGGVYGKKLLKLVVLAAFLSVGMELVKDALQQATTQANLDSIILDYNTLGRERFVEKLLDVCRRDNLPHLQASADSLRRWAADRLGRARESGHVIQNPDGLALKDDTVHYNADGLIELGDRFFDAWKAAR